MAVPETPVYEHYGSMLREYEIRSPGKPLVVKAISESEAVQVASNYELWPGVFPAYPRHDLGAPFGRESVSHGVFATR
jgi:hypothetical protein